MRHFWMVMFTASLWMACGGKIPKEALIKQIEEQEKGLYNDQNTYILSDSMAGKTIDAYLQFADAFKDDPKSADYLFKAADLYRALRKHTEALNIYARIIADYPQHERTPFSYFLQGFIYENDLNQPEKARPFYETFLKNFPEHPMAKDVQFSLDYLGKSPEEIIKSFEQKQASDQAL